MTRPSKDPVGHPSSAAVEAVVPSAQSIPPCPHTLGDLGAAMWADVWAAGGSAYSPKTDRWVISRYCDLHERRRDLVRLVDSEGFMEVGSQGQNVLNPAVRALDSVEKELRALEDRLGLNPESRARLGIAVAEAESKLEKFLKGSE